MEDFRTITIPGFASLGLVNSGSSGSHPQWTNIHFGIHHFSQKSQGCVGFCCPRSRAQPYCRGSCCLHGKGCRSGRTRFMEGSHLLGSCASSLRFVCLHCDRRHGSCRGSAQISTLDSIYCGLRATIHRICCFEIRRGWNGCSQVRA